MSAGDLWDLPKGKGMAEGYHEQPVSGLSTWGGTNVQNEIRVCKQKSKGNKESGKKREQQQESETGS